MKMEPNETTGTEECTEKACTEKACTEEAKQEAAVEPVATECCEKPSECTQPDVDCAVKNAESTDGEQASA